jgi:hypothetical protein
MYAGGESDRPGRSSEFLHTDALHTHERITIQAHRVSQPWLTAQTLVYALFERTATQPPHAQQSRARQVYELECTLLSDSGSVHVALARWLITVSFRYHRREECLAASCLHSHMPSVRRVNRSWVCMLQHNPCGLCQRADCIYVRSLTCSAWAGSVLRSRV